MKGSNSNYDSLEAQLNDTDRDVISFGNTDAKLQGMDSVDPITSAVREEIILKQQDLIFNSIVKDLDKDDSTKEELEKNYLQNRIFPSQKLVDKALKDKDLQDEIYKIEKQGYHSINEQFKDRFKNVDWSSVQGSDQKSTEIKINDKVVCNLSQETIKNKPFVAILSNGLAQEITSYRKINLPKQLDGGTGPMHAMFAARDANGLAITAKDAVYFSVHYDDNGKLSEVSTPVPIKFAGKGDDAIGYIERNGQIYTLPVDQGTYKTLMQEVTKNKGCAKDISSVEIEQAPKSQAKKNKKENTPERDPIPEKYKNKPLPKPPVPSKKPRTPKQDNIDQSIPSDSLSSSAYQWKNAKPKKHEWVSAKPSALKEESKQIPPATPSNRISDLVKKFGADLIQKLDQIRQKIVKYLPTTSREKIYSNDIETGTGGPPVSPINKKPDKANNRPGNGPGR